MKISENFAFMMTHH